MSRATKRRHAKRARDAAAVGAPADQAAIQPAEAQAAPPAADTENPPLSKKARKKAAQKAAAAAASGVAAQATSAERPTCDDMPQGAGGSEGSGPYREWQMPMPTAGNPLFDVLEMALDEAESIRGRKYRYGALLVAGEDCIPLRSGSNKKPFQRENIHAEASVLKGCERAEGKDMVIGRVAPTRDAAGRDAAGRDAALSWELDDEEADGGAAGGADGGAAGAERAPAAASRPKVLNARPCARCEAKMVARGIRRCFFTLNSRTLGVLEYNPD